MFTDACIYATMATCYQDGRRPIVPPERGGMPMTRYDFMSFVLLVTIIIVALKA